MFPYLSNQVFQACPWNLWITLLKGFGEIGVENLLAYAEVRFVKVICDVPSNLSILSPLLYHSMEEGKSKYQRREGIVRTFCQGLS